jgi:hypothetical protein
VSRAVSEFHRLFDEAIVEVRPTAPLAFQTAVSMLPLVERAKAIDLLRRRLENLGTFAERSRVHPGQAEHVPPHALAMVDYWPRVVAVEHDWLVELLSRIDDGELSFLGEAMDLTPADDDPGHQMADDRSRYLGLLDR